MAMVPTTGLMSLLMLVVLGGGIGLPLGVPPQQPDPMLTHAAPPHCLYYVAWVGMADPDPASGNHTERLLAEPEVQLFIRELRTLATQAAERFGQHGAPFQQAVASHAPLLAEVLLTHATLVFVERVTPQPSGALVVNLGDDVAAFQDALRALRACVPAALVQDVQVAGIACVRIQPPGDAPEITIGMRDSYLIVAVGQQSLEGVIERVQRATPPDWLTQAVADAQLPPRPSTLGYLNVEEVLKVVGSAGGPQVQAALDALGLSELTRVVSVSGLDDEGFVRRTRVWTRSRDRGLLKLLPDKPLTAEQLAGIPHDVSLAAVLRLDLAQVLEQALAVSGALQPAAAQRLAEQLAAVERQLGFAIKHDLLDALGDVWTVHTAPSGGGLLAGWTLTVDVRDRNRLQATHAQLLKAAQAWLDRAPADRAPRIRTFQAGGVEAYTLEVPTEEFLAAPSWCLTETHLVITPFPQTLKSYLAPRDAGQSVADQPAVARLLDADSPACALTYQDTRSQFLTFYPLLQVGAQLAARHLAQEGLDIDPAVLPSTSAIAPHLLAATGAVRRTADGWELESRGTLPGMSLGASTPMLVALLLPAVQAAREAARRTQSMNNLKMMGLALHNYHVTHQAFPPAYSVDQRGQPLLSWRVHILPYLDQQALYKEFHLDEPWDSEHNKQLIPQMPQVYASPNSVAGPGKTVYLGNASKDGVFVPPKESDDGAPVGLSLPRITDGTSNTILAVEANHDAAVTWTRPDDFAASANDPWQGLRGMRPGGFLALLCDGSVRFVAESLDLDQLKALFTAGGGEAVGIDH